MIEKLPAEQASEVAEDFGKLADEAVKPKPNRKWYSVSVDGLVKAAENIGKVGEPVINLSRKVLSLLTVGTRREFHALWNKPTARWLYVSGKAPATLLTSYEI